MSAATMPLIENLENYDYLRRPIKSHERSPGKTPYLGASGEVDRVEGFTHEGDFLCVSEDGENLRSRRTPIAWVQRGQFWANNHLHVLGGASVARLRFLAAAVAWTDISGYLTGSAQPKLSQASLARVEIPRFTHSEQEAIGGVLGALDDKIAANFGTSECAEHLQSALWKKARSQVSLQPLSRFVTPKLGGTPPRADATSWEGTVPWASVRDMTSAPGRVILTTAENISHEASESAPRLQAHPVGSVFMSARGTVGHVTTNAVPCAINQSAYAFTPLEKYRVSCRLALQDAVATLRAHAHGSVFNTITTKNLTGLVIPDLESSAIAEAEPDLARLEALRIAALSENTTLTAVRDELLPQLMSGRITVKDAEKRVEEEV